VDRLLTAPQGLDDAPPTGICQGFERVHMRYSIYTRICIQEAAAPSPRRVAHGGDVTSRAVARSRAVPGAALVDYCVGCPGVCAAGMTPAGNGKLPSNGGQLGTGRSGPG